MSNAMSRSKSRWKAVLLATVATATVAPLAAKAQSLQVSLSLTPLGDTTPGISNGQSIGYKTNEFVAPDAPVNIYVYATVTSPTAISPTNIAGLSYLYYNINATNSTNTSGGVGTITGATLNSTTNVNFSGNGSQLGTIGNTSNGLAVGETTNASSLDITGVAKPRSSQYGVFSDKATADGVNAIYTSNTATFLVETLKYTPNFTAAAIGTSGSSTPSTSLSVTIPTLPGIYPTANYFVNQSTDPTTANPGVGLNTGYSASTTAVTLYDADLGDANLDGSVNSLDASILVNNFGKAISGFTNANFAGDATVDSLDASDLVNGFGKSYGPATGVPSEGASPLAVLAELQALAGGSSVPEPTSLGLIAIAGLGLVGRRRVKA